MQFTLRNKGHAVCSAYAMTAPMLCLKNITDDFHKEESDIDICFTLLSDSCMKVAPYFVGCSASSKTQ
jgi:hypothetical protein